MILQKRWNLADKWWLRREVFLQTSHKNEEWHKTCSVFPQCSQAWLMETAQDLQKYLVSAFSSLFVKVQIKHQRPLWCELSLCLMIFVQSPHLLLVNQEQDDSLLLQLPTKLALITTCPGPPSLPLEAAPYQEHTFIRLAKNNKQSSEPVF